MKIIGIDLSGPANHQDTVMSIFTLNDSHIGLDALLIGASDEELLQAIAHAALDGEVVIGIDAPLSYEDGGGDRAQDKEMRQFAKKHGLSPSSIMPPTLTKMVYLTLRGISLTRSMMTLPYHERISIVEVHPGTVIGSRINKERMSHVLQYKKELASRKKIKQWLDTAGLKNLPNDLADSSHRIDACAAALAAWHWGDPNKQPTWYWDKTSTAHPFVCCC